MVVERVRETRSKSFPVETSKTVLTTQQNTGRFVRLSLNVLHSKDSPINFFASFSFSVFPSVAFLWSFLSQRGERDEGGARKKNTGSKLLLHREILNFRDLRISQ